MSQIIKGLILRKIKKLLIELTEIGHDQAQHVFRKFNSNSQEFSKTILSVYQYYKLIEQINNEVYKYHSYLVDNLPKIGHCEWQDPDRLVDCIKKMFIKYVYGEKYIKEFIRYVYNYLKDNSFISEKFTCSFARVNEIFQDIEKK